MHRLISKHSKIKVFRTMQKHLILKTTWKLETRRGFSVDPKGSLAVEIMLSLEKNCLE